MSSANHPNADEADGHTGVDTMAGILAVLAVLLAGLALFRTPALLVAVGTIIAFTAARMSHRVERLALFAVVANVVCFVVGMTLAVITEHSLL